MDAERVEIYKIIYARNGEPFLDEHDIDLEDA